MTTAAVADRLWAMAFYLAVGGGVHLIAYGVNGGSYLSIFVVAVAWPLAIVWWLLPYALMVFAFGLAVLGLLWLAEQV